MPALDFLFLGIALGLSAGLSPGPLQAIVISETYVKLGISSAWFKGFAANITNPHPYMFWLLETKRYFFLIKFLRGSA